MQCPYCNEQFHSKTKRIETGFDREDFWTVPYEFCKNDDCSRLIMHVNCYEEVFEGDFLWDPQSTRIITIKGESSDLKRRSI
jgi:hypothetical protein